MKAMIDGEPISGASSESTNEVYRNEEVQIGTWTNGKPLYRRIIETTGGCSIQYFTDTKIAEIPDVEKLVRIDGTQNNAYPLQYSWAGTNANGDYITYNWTIFFVASSNCLMARYTCSVKNTTTYSIPLVVILEYTKTTD